MTKLNWESARSREKGVESRKGDLYGENLVLPEGKVRQRRRQRIYLNDIPSEQQAAAKRAGAIFDLMRKVWFYPDKARLPLSLAKYKDGYDPEKELSERAKAKARKKSSYLRQKAERKEARKNLTVLCVPYSMKEEAKAFGARWDAKRKLWYYEGVQLPERLEKFRKVF